MGTNPTIRKHSRAKRLVFIGCTLFVTLLVLELALHGLCLASARVDRLLGSTYWTAPNPPVPDDTLGFRGNPNDPDYDERGFRNAKGLEAATLVALGDSQTFGENARRADAYPQQVAATTGIPVYNMAFGGYCPIHSWQLLDEALALKPKLVVLGVYAGNDFYECYEVVYEKGRLPELKSKDAAVLQTITDLNIRQTLDERINQSFYGNDQSELRKFLSQWSKLYALLRAVKDKIVYPDDWAKQKHLAEAYGLNIAFESPEARTIFTPRYRMNALVRHDPRIEEGKRVTWEVIRMIHDKASKQRVNLLVLLIPTKELVFKELVDRDTPHVDPEYQELVSSEIEAWEQTRSSLRDHGIEWIDPLPALRKSLQEKKSPYSANPDGHPNAVGYRAIADAVIAGLSERGWLPQAPPK